MPSAQLDAVGRSGRQSTIKVTVNNTGEALDDESVEERRGSDRGLEELVINLMAQNVERGGRAARAIEQRFFTQRRGRAR